MGRIVINIEGGLESPRTKEQVAGYGADAAGGQIAPVAALARKDGWVIESCTGSGSRQPGRRAVQSKI